MPFQNPICTLSSSLISLKKKETNTVPKWNNKTVEKRQPKTVEYLRFFKKICKLFVLIYAGFSTTCILKISEDAVFGKTSDRATLQMLLASTNTANIVLGFWPPLRQKEICLKPPVRIELTTPGLQDQCSNHWAMEAGWLNYIW